MNIRLVSLMGPLVLALVPGMLPAHLPTEHCYTRQDLVQLQKMSQLNQSEASDMQRHSFAMPPSVEPVTQSASPQR